MKYSNKQVILFFLCSVLIFCCSKKEPQKKVSSANYTYKPSVSAEKLPADIKWLTNDEDPVYSAEKIKKGGTLNMGILSFPLTFRVVGPDSNSGFRSFILDNQLSLIEIHPNTKNIIPILATHWAFDKDKKTMYFKLNKKARWSDGVPVTAKDYAYTLEFMRSKYIVAPWYNDYYTKEIEKVIIYDTYTIAVVATKQDPDLFLKVGISPTPSHFYGKLDKKFVKKYNWAMVPNTGAYQLEDFVKGKSLRFTRKKNWWGKDLRYFKNRFNVDHVVLKVINDLDIMWEYFKKGQIDVFGVTLPSYWYEKTKSEEFQKGYIQKIWFYNDKRQPSYGMYLNMDKDIFKDRNVRYAFAHAMNVQKVIDKVLRKDYFRLENGYIGYGKYSNNKIRARRFNLQKVDYYMKKSGWQRNEEGIWEKNGRKFSVEVVYSFDAHTPRLVVLKEEAKKAGIELRLQKLDGAAAYKKVMEKKHDVAWWAWSTSYRPRFWEHYHSVNAHKPQTNNITNTDDPELDKKIDKYRTSVIAEERIRLSKILQERVHKIGAYIPTFMVPYVREAYWRWFKLPPDRGTKESESLFDPFNVTTGGLFWFDRTVKEETVAAIINKKSFKPVTIIDETYKMDILR